MESDQRLEQPCRIQVGDRFIEGTITVERACSHPELTMDNLPDGRHYRCRACGKHIVISLFQFADVESSQELAERFAGLIGLAFGEQWARRARRLNL